MFGVPGSDLTKGGDLGSKGPKAQSQAQRLFLHEFNQLWSISKSPLRKMTISVHEASLEDLPQMTDLAARAFMDGETFGDFMHPHHNESPED